MLECKNWCYVTTSYVQVINTFIYGSLIVYFVYIGEMRFIGSRVGATKGSYNNVSVL
jgi:hypothetical protein